MQDPTNSRDTIATGHRRLFDLLRSGDMTTNKVDPDPSRFSDEPAPKPSSQDQLREIQLKAAQSLYYRDR